MNRDDGITAACQPTLNRLQRALDGGMPFTDVAADPHAAACRSCRERLAAARLFLAVYTAPATPPAVPAGYADQVLNGVRAGRRARFRGRVFAAAGGLAIAAGVLVAVLVFRSPPPAPESPRHGIVQQPPPVPATPRAAAPVRIETELAKASDALRDATGSIAGPVASGSKVFTSLTNVLTPPVAPTPPDLEPTQQAFADLPAAARQGLEPVTASAQKAFARLLKDVGAAAPATKPKS